MNQASIFFDYLVCDAKLENVLAAAVEARIEDSLDFILFVSGVFGGDHRIW